MQDEDIPLELTTLYFASEVLKLPLYDWQAEVLTVFERSFNERVKVSLCTPNSAGKSERCVATVTLWWLAIHPRGKVVITSKSGLQIDTQIWPALKAHQGKVQWKFTERKIETPTGGLCILFTTDESSRAEGHHQVGESWDGPVLIIVDEAKSVDEDIFMALDRCSYRAIFYASSPGLMAGRFYKSQTDPMMGFYRRRVGLLECPHILQSKIDDIVNMYGSDHPFTRSTLHGEFMTADERSVFDQAGMDRIKTLVEAAKPKHGTLTINENGIIWQEDSQGWLTVWEMPQVGLAYLGCLDTCKNEQAKAAKDPDEHAFFILRKAHKDYSGRLVNTRVACRIRPPCRWGAKVLAEKIALVHKWYGDPMIVPEINAGLDVLVKLQDEGMTIYQRQQFDRVNPGRTVRINGWFTDTKTRPILVDAIRDFVREQTLDCECPQVLDQMRSFAYNNDGKACAISGCHDDTILSLGIGLANLDSASVYIEKPVIQFVPPWLQQEQRKANGAVN